MTTAAQLRDSGQAAVLAADVAPHRGYADLVIEAVESFTGLPFDAEMIREDIAREHPDAQPHHPNVIGATLGGLAAAGRIRAINFRQSTRPSSRCRVLRVWQVVPTKESA